MEETKSIRNHFSKVGGIYFIFGLLAFATQNGLVWLVKSFTPRLLENTAVSLLISMIPLYCIATPICIWMMKKVPATHIEQKKMRPGKLVVALIITFAGMYIGNIVGLILTAIIGAIKGSAVNNDIVNVVMGTDMWGTVLVVVLIAPLVEEFLFRKLLIDRVVKYGEGLAVVLSGVMFGLFHGNLNQFFYATIIGMMFAYIYVKTGRIWYSVLMHMIINFFGSVVAVLVIQSIDLEGIAALESMDPNNMEAMTEQMMAILPSLVVYMIYIVFLLGVILAGVILFALNRRKFVCSAGELEMTKKEKRKLVLGNAGMILYVIYWIVMMVIQFMQ